MTLADCRAWVFDLDGTLTVPQHDFDAIRRELGIPQGELILEHLASLPAPDSAHLHARLEAIEADLAQAAEPAEGAAELIERLHGEGRPVGILTRNSRRNALMALRAIGLEGLICERFVLGREDCAAKPDPEGVFRLLGAWDVAPAAAVMVGDYLLDLQTGRAAGTRTVHVDARERAWPALTDLRVGSLGELLRLLD